ncbi:MAG: oligosaccharide flippase family protein [Deltaproteobacteria bacterium]|nr:oligosaccharide flippase family protein [Deltaproteobacteria bacterium]
MTTGSNDGVREDARDLHRGVLVNTLGYGVKIAYPVLLVLVVRLYGAERFGVFCVVQAALLFTMRLCLLGFDKGIMWWIPRLSSDSERQGLRSALVITGVLSALAASGIALWAAPWIADWSGEPEAVSSLRLMTAGLVPMTLMEMFIHAMLGKRRMAAQVVVREGVVSVVLVLAGVGFYFLGFEDSGLALAFVVSSGAGLLTAIWMFSRVFRKSRWSDKEWRLPPELVRYSLPMWLSELANSFLLRMDMYMLAALTEPRIVGIYAAVMQVGNTIRAVRRSFDPIVFVLFSRIGAERDAARLKAGFSHATVLVIATQMPIYAFLIAFAPWLMSLFGTGFEQGSVAVLILCAFWILNGVVGLNGLIVSGYGRSDLTLFNVLVTIVAEGALLLLLVPRFGLEGAAIAVGLAYTLQNTVQLFEARWITGAWNYNRDVLVMLIVGAFTGVLMGATWFGLSPLGDSLRRILSFCAYLLASGGGLLWMYRNGRLSGRSGAV